MYNVSYEIIEPFTPDKVKVKLDRIPMAIISHLIKKGTKFYPRDLIAENNKIISHGCTAETFATYHYKSFGIAVKSGILKKPMRHYNQN